MGSCFVMQIAQAKHCIPAQRCYAVHTPIICATAMTTTSLQRLLAGALCAFACSASATGDYSMPTWLENGGVVIEKSPEFFWHRQLRKIAAPFKPTQQRVLSSAPSGKEAPAEPEALAAQIARLDAADFREALSKGLIKAGANAEAQHEAARAFVAAANESTVGELPEEPDSEFRDYNLGALAFHRGEKHYAEAAKTWQALLARPEAECHYRSVWAAFMLGKVALFTHQTDAPKWFRMARQLAKAGFADSPGLAADSYGWEAKSELEQDHLEKAAQLYLTQLALGDDSAIVSLKSLVPDRTNSYGMMNFNPDPPEGADPEAVKKFNEKQEATIGPRLDRAAHDPLLRRIVTAHVLATETDHYAYLDDENNGGAKKISRSERWLSAIEKAGLKAVEDAAQLGWVAYTAGDYDGAGRWLKLADPNTSAALWLKSKLLRREGKLSEASEAMATALKLVRDEEPPDPDGGMADGAQFLQWFSNDRQPVSDASADLATLHLSRGDFINALDVFMTGGLRFDAAYVAERVLNADELKKYVDAHFPEDKVATENSPASFIRWLLGRRLVREDRYDEARGYLPEQHRGELDKYVVALTDAANDKLPKAKRARAWFTAASIARYSGMELMGTEGAPDHFIAGGDFEFADIAGERETGTIKGVKFEGEKEVPDIKKIHIAVPVTAEEKKRLVASKTAPEKRFHYRYIAAALGWKAAQLLPDQSEELADVLNSSGSWISGDDKAADKFFQAIEHRASRTPLGREAGAKHWFVKEHYGPWSEAPVQR